MSIPIQKADYILTEQKIDEIRSSNLKANELSTSVFVSTLEKYIKNGGLTFPHDSDPGFYKDHYEKEVKARIKPGDTDSPRVSKRYLLKDEINVRSTVNHTLQVKIDSVEKKRPLFVA